MLSVTEQILVALVGGAVGGVLVQGARVLFDLYLESRRRRRSGLEELVKALSPVYTDLGAQFALGAPKWETRERWWPRILERFAKLGDEWWADWSFRVRNGDLNAAVRETYRSAVTAGVLNGLDRESEFLAEIDKLKMNMDTLYGLAMKELGVKWKPPELPVRGIRSTC